MPRRQRKSVEEPMETVKLAIDQLFQKIVSSEEPEFPLISSLTAQERAYIHVVAHRLGLKTKSRGNGDKRFVTIYKPEGSTIVQKDAVLRLTPQTRQLMENVLAKCPLTHRERQDLLPPTERDRNQAVDPLRDAKVGKMTNTKPPIVPPDSKTTQEMDRWRKSLPAYKRREEILQTIASNPVCIIQGETGCGKTTQVPQYILEQAREQRVPCRILVTEPRRIACTSVSERVAAERNEQLGTVVGYQIRLESKYSADSNIMFCTPGIVVSNCISDAYMANLTHIIIDEVHERDRFCDFMLICLRDLRNRFPQLRIILMSATANTNLFERYFNCPVISIPGRSYAVKEFYLLDALKLLTQSAKKSHQSNSRATQKSALGSSDGDLILESTTSSLLDELIAAAENDAAELPQLLYTLLSEGHPVNYKHKSTGMTALMVAAAQDQTMWLKTLLQNGADPSIKSAKALTALQLAKAAKANDAAAFLESLGCATEGISEADQKLLDEYLGSRKEDSVDADLIVSMIFAIHKTKPPGGILVFLPGWEDILRVHDKFREEESSQSGHGSKMRVYLLHSQNRSDLKNVFKPVPDRMRKVIFSTNIAETSITVDDVVYVIDSGKVKEHSFDSFSGVSQLSSVWISKACAAQRRGRAGRCQEGVCYRLYTKLRYDTFEEYTTPEILKRPLEDLCLHAKDFVQNNSIADFLNKAVEPPAQRVIRDAVQLLKTMDALNTLEELTPIGKCLLQLSTEPRLGKMLLLAVLLKCLDPVLTIVSCLDSRNPFKIASYPSERNRLRSEHKKISEETFSDHFVLLRLFQGYQQAIASRSQAQFCERYGVSSGTMDVINSTRTHLMAQLRNSGLVRKDKSSTGDIRDLNTNSDSWAVVKACLCAGLYPNIARVDRDMCVIRTRKECKVAFHKSSVLSDGCSNPTDWVIYHEMIKVGRFCNLRTCTFVSPHAVALVAGPPNMVTDGFHDDGMRPDLADPLSDSETEEEVSGARNSLRVDDWIEFCANQKDASAVVNLHLKLQAVFLRRLTNAIHQGKLTPTQIKEDDTVIKLTVDVLKSEDVKLNLVQPQGVGQRPRHADDHHLNNAMNGLQINRRWRNEAGAEATESTRYFIVRAPTTKALEMAMVRSTWQFAQNTERKLIGVVRDGGQDVILFFTVNQTAAFRGVAKIRGGSQLQPSQPWQLIWIKTHAVSFSAAKNVTNGNQDLRRINFSRDGQEVPEGLGRALLRLWDQSLLGPRPSPPAENDYINFMNNRALRGGWPQYMPRRP